MIKKTIQLTGLDCANCASELERTIEKIEGVRSASLTFVNQRLYVEYDNESVWEKIVYAANHFEEVHVVEKVEKRSNYTKEWVRIGVSVFCFLLGFLLERFGNSIGIKIGAYIAYAIAYVSVGFSVWVATCKNVAKGKIFDENFLMTIASVGAVCLGEIFEGVAVMLLYTLGETLQSIAVEASRGSLVTLMEMKSEKTTALRKTDGKTALFEISPEEVQIGDKLIVKTGERIPVDGVLLSDKAELDMKALTGETELGKRTKGDELLSGCINVGAVFQMQAMRIYEHSAVGRILDMVENAAAGKAAPEKFITRFARIYTPVVCALALILAIVAPFLNGVFIGAGFQFVNASRWIRSALTFLVVSCPCALVISVPLTYFSGIGACAKSGILVKGATYLDTVAKADIVAFDKTGTLTEGNFTVCKVITEEGVLQEDLLSLVATVEKNSAHPIAQAFKSYASIDNVEDIQELSGRGVTGVVDGKKLLVGNAKLLQEYGIAFSKYESPYTLVYVALDGKCLGVVEVGDKIKEEAKSVVEALRSLGIKRSVMLTGDNAARAQKIADEAGVYEVNAELLPDGKLQSAEKLKRQGTLLYVGDGINDAPVMVAADCAVSMGKLGSAAAIEASDLVLVSDDLNALPRVIRIAKKTRRIVMQNIVFSIIMKVAFMALGVAGILQLWLAVFADVGVMLLAVLNSLRVQK